MSQKTKGFLSRFISLIYYDFKNSFFLKDVGVNLQVHTCMSMCVFIVSRETVMRAVWEGEEGVIVKWRAHTGTEREHE